MKILLLAVNAKYIHTNLAIYSLRQYALWAAAKNGDNFCGDENYGKEHIFLREYTINHMLDEILRGIYEVHPQVLCISCYLWNIRMVEEIVADYKKIDPNVHIYLGGPEVSFDAAECLQRIPAVDGVMVGEGEATFYELARSYFQYKEASDNKWESLAKEAQRFIPDGGQGNLIKDKRENIPPGCAEIRSLVFRGEDGRIYVNPLREPLNFSELPFAYADMENFDNFRHKIIYYETSRGCPFSCCYCLSSVEKSLRLRKLSLVEEELQFFLDCHVAQVKFVDRTFNCNKAHAMHIWNFLYEHDNGVTNFHFEIAADLLDEEQIALLNKMRPGFVQLEIVVQSTNPRTIEAIRRRMDLEKVKRYVAQVKRARNIHQHLDLIAGLPYEDYVSFAKSFDDVYHMEPDQLQLGFLKVLKGSAMADMAEEHQITFKTMPPYEVLSTKYLSYVDLLHLKDIEEMVEVYYNSGQFLYSLPYLLARFEGPFKMFERLAEYYREEGLFERRHSRMERYEILYCFVKERHSQDLADAHCNSHRDYIADQISDFPACFAQCLLCDFYCREKPKSQLSFARAIDCGKQQLKEVFAAFGVEREESGQYYVARFDYDMDAARKGQTVKKKGYLLFDYTSRDSLSGACAIRYREEDTDAAHCSLCDRDWGN